MNKQEKSTDDILAAIKDLMENKDSSQDDIPLSEDVLELTKPITDDVLELTSPIEAKLEEEITDENKEEIASVESTETLNLTQLIDEDFNIIDLKDRVSNNILKEENDLSIRKIIRAQLKESIENKIDIIIKEELSALISEKKELDSIISERVSLSELALKSEVLK
tara:strand:- start:4582 stop:5079 length:498 start_codon:yes stop_codon:yes gene_type:complete